jgi:small subunit ribosomal protein S21
VKGKTSNASLVNFRVPVTQINMTNKTCGPAEFDFSRVHPLEVVVEGSSREDFEFAVRKFKSLFQKERIVGQIKEKMAFEKPSVKKRRKRIEAVERRRIADAREKMMQTGEWDRRQKRKEKSKIEKAEKRAKSQQ